MGNTSNNKWIKTWSIVQDEQAGAHYLVSGGDVMGEAAPQAPNNRAQPAGNTLLVGITWQGTPFKIGLVKNIADVYK